MRALTSTIAGDHRRRSATDALSDARRAEWLALVRLFANLDDDEATAS